MSNPTKITQPFAANGDKSVIPNTSSNDSIATLSLGFPPKTAQAIASGGAAPTREDFNGILNLLSQHTVYNQNGNFYEYDNTLDYAVNAIVLYNSQLYRCIQANGASSTVVAPTNTFYWTEFNEQKLYSSTGSATDGSMSQNAITTAINNINTIPVGTIIPIIGGASAYVPTGLVACDGAQYSKAQYPTLWSDYLTAQTPKLVTCSYADYATSITNYGQCAKWAIDTVNETFKVPTIKDGSFMQQALTDAEIGKAYNAGLPNITGTFTNSDDSYATGAFGVTSEFYGTEDGGGYQHIYDFDASRSSSIYGNSTTVQPNAVTVRYFVCIAGGTTNQSLMDWSAFNSALAGKLNTDHTNDAKPYLKTTYVNGTSGYNIWSNGYCEQWGRINQSSYGVNIALTKTYSSTEYNALAIKHRDNAPTSWGPTQGPVCITNMTESSFYANSGSTDEGGHFYIFWKTSGYLASGQY